MADRTDPLAPVLLGLTVATGIIDAVSYLGLGRVFTANMTGNVVLLGFAAAGVPGQSVARSTVALLAFLIGALVGGRLGRRMGTSPRNRWTGFAFGLEGALVTVATAISLGCPASEPIAPIHLYSLIVLTGLAMGVRNATVRKLGVPDLTTTVLTLTITGLAADSSLAGGSNAGWGRRVSAILALLAGAALGALLLESSLALALGAGAVITSVCAGAAYVGDRAAVAAS